MGTSDRFRANSRTPKRNRLNPTAAAKYAVSVKWIEMNLRTGLMFTALSEIAVTYQHKKGSVKGHGEKGRGTLAKVTDAGDAFAVKLQSRSQRLKAHSQQGAYGMPEGIP